MLDPKKPRDPREKGPTGAGLPRTSRITRRNVIPNSSNVIDPAQRLSSLSEHWAPSPAPGPLTKPPLGGLSRSPILMGHQAASLWLTQLKAQLALTQIHNALAISSRATAFKANSSSSASYPPSTPPSPTAVAISLINLLKIANTMSRPLYNPYAFGIQSSSQGQYGLISMQAERDPLRASYPMPSVSAPLDHRHSDIGSGCNSLDWSSNYQTSSADYTYFHSSNYASGSESRFNASSDREHDRQSIPGLGDYDYPVPDKPTAPTESCRPKYTSESAASILLRFGLEKDDLEHLISYPEHQITPDNLPFILRQIRIQKMAKRTTTEVQPKPYPEPQSTRTMSGMERHGVSTSGGPGKGQGEMTSAVQLSKVIEYGHTGKYTGGVGNESGKDGKTVDSRADSSGIGRMLMDACNSIRQPLQKKPSEVKSSVLGSSRDQGSSVSSLSSSYTSVLNSVTPPSHNRTQSNLTSQTASSFSLPKKDSNIRVLKSEASKPVPSKEPETARQSAPKTQPQCSLLRGVHPSRPGLVVIDRNDGGILNKTRGQGNRQLNQQKQEMLNQKGQLIRPVAPAPHGPSITDTSKAMQHVVSIPQPILALNLNHTMPSPNKRPPETVSSSMGPPTPAMTVQDCAAASPRVSPHACCLGNRDGDHLKDWNSHQNTSLHLENCKLRQYRAAVKDDKPSASTSARNCHAKARHRDASRSSASSPHRRNGSEGRGKKRRRRSRSPPSPRSTRRSWSPSHSPWYDSPTCYWSRSRSPERPWSPPRWSNMRPSPPRWRNMRPSPPRSNMRQSPPRWSNMRPSPPRWCNMRQSPPRWCNMGQSPPRWSNERPSPPRWCNLRPSPPRWSNKRQSPPRSDDRQSPPRWSNERPSPQRWSNMRPSPPRWCNLRPSPPRWSNKRQSPPRSDDRQSPPRWSNERPSPPRWCNMRQSPPRWCNMRQSPPGSSDETQLLPQDGEV